MPKLSIINSLRRRWKRSIPSDILKASPALNLGEGEVSLVTYTSAADKMKAFAAFIREGIVNGDLTDYTYPDEESETVRAKLKEHGIDVEKYERKGALLLKSLTEYYMPDGKFDNERAIRKGLDARAEAKRKGYKHYRDLEDVGDFSFLNGKWQEFLEFWDDPRWGSPGAGLGVLYEPFIIELITVNVGGMCETGVLELLKAFGGGEGPPTRFARMRLLEYADAFSKRIGMPHQKLLGRKFLLEFDPVSDYEKVVDHLARESMANVEPIFVFTPSTSPIHEYLANQSAIKFFLTSLSTSTPKSISENKVLLPAKNTPLILDTLNKVLETNADANVCFVFDILSELLTTIGQERTFTFLRHALDMLSSEKTTSLFLLNTSAHELEVVSRVRTLFPNLLTYEQTGLKVIKIS